MADRTEAILALDPPVVSSIMGVYPPDFVRRLKERGIAWFATVTTVEEALAAQAAGADVIVAQGMEAGGHRGTFDDARPGDFVICLGAGNITTWAQALPDQLAELQQQRGGHAA